MRTLILTLIGVCSIVPAQTKGPSFEVTSVKPQQITRGGAGTPPTCSGGRFIAVSPLVLVVRWAYDLTIPAGLLSQQLQSVVPDVYEIQGSADHVLAETECRQMVRALLADRFKFTAHIDTKEGQVYDLVIARGGHKLQRVADSDQEAGFNITIDGRKSQSAPGAPVIRGMTMSEFAKFLSTRMTGERRASSTIPVFDKTGLEGMFKITLAYSFPRLAPKQTFSDPELEGAIQQQLGLRLEERKGPVESFVIDHIEMPGPN